jgi:hypothetical protein
MVRLIVHFDYVTPSGFCPPVNMSYYNHITLLGLFRNEAKLIF